MHRSSLHLLESIAAALGAESAARLLASMGRAGAAGLRRAILRVPWIGELGCTLVALAKVLDGDGNQ